MTSAPATDRRTALVDAALEVLADGGARGLTHRAVDDRARVPQGSTSNYFRTRDALLLAALDRLLARESDGFTDAARQLAEQGADPRRTLMALGAGALEAQLGADRELALARQSVMAEACRRPELRAPLERATAVWWDRVAVLLAAAGSTDPGRHARWLLAAVDGLVSDQLCRPQRDFDAVAAITVLVAGMLP